MNADIIFLSLIPKSLLSQNSLNILINSNQPPDFKVIINEVANHLKKDAHSFFIESLIKKSEKIISDLKFYDINFTSIWHSDYPVKLKTIQSPPIVIYFSGKLPDSNKVKLATVGSRKPNKYGYELIRNILKNIPVNIEHISGLAFGTDSLAHLQTLESGVTNFAVLGNGIDSIYPNAHTGLADLILKKGGGILSEYPPGTIVKPYHFPWRNRIIAGLSDVIWIPQATAKSGSLHTVLHALEQGKIIAVTPGSIFDELAELPNRLLQEGAHPILKAEDLNLLLQ